MKPFKLNVQGAGALEQIGNLVFFCSDLYSTTARVASDTFTPPYSGVKTIDSPKWDTTPLRLSVYCSVFYNVLKCKFGLCACLSL